MKTVLAVLVLGAAACVDSASPPSAVTATLPPTTTTTTTTAAATTTTAAAAAVVVAVTVPPPEVCVLSYESMREKPGDEIREAQREVGAHPDGKWGPKSAAAARSYCADIGYVRMPPQKNDRGDGFDITEWETELPPIGEDCKWAYYDPSLPDCPGGNWGRLVTVREAHRSGGAEWDIVRKQEFYADPANLFVTSSQTLAAKSDKDPVDWSPNIRQHKKELCRYLHDWMTIKNRWELSANRNERASLYITLNNFYGNETPITYYSSVCF